MHTLMRGSGRLLPKVFAVALGLAVSRGAVCLRWRRRLWRSSGRPIPQGTSQLRHPGLGSVRPVPGPLRLQPSLASGLRLRTVCVRRGCRRRISVLFRTWLPPSEPPTLRRFGPARPFAYYGGPGYPDGECSNYYAPVSGLIIEKPVVTIGEPGDFGYVNENGDVYPGRDFGSFTGALPYPETLFAPYTFAAASTGSSGAEGEAKPVRPPYTPPAARSGAPSPSLSPAIGAPIPMHAPARYLGIDEEPVVDNEGVRGIKVSKVYPGSAAEKAGLHEGDIIHSINGYLTTEHGNLAWIIAVATPNNVLKMTVRSQSDGKIHTILAELPTPPVDTDRPPYLPPVGTGPPPSSR